MRIAIMKDKSGNLCEVRPTHVGLLTKDGWEFVEEKDVPLGSRALDGYPDAKRSAKSKPVSDARGGASRG